MLHLTLTPAIVIPALWVTEPDALPLEDVIRHLDAGDGAVGAEAVMDAGGWANLLVSAQWVKPGERPRGLEMDLRATIQRMMQTAHDRCGGNDIKAAAMLGVNPSTLYRWRKRLTTPTYGPRSYKSVLRGDSDLVLVKEA